MTEMTGYEYAKLVQAQYAQQVAELSARLQVETTGPMGLTPDHIKFSPEYQANKRAYAAAFARLRVFNARFVEVFKTDIAAERKVRRG